MRKRLAITKTFGKRVQSNFDDKTLQNEGMATWRRENYFRRVLAKLSNNYFGIMEEGLKCDILN